MVALGGTISILSYNNQLNQHQCNSDGIKAPSWTPHGDPRLSPGACQQPPLHVGCPVVLDQGRPRQPRPCRALGVSSLPGHCARGFPGWRGPPAPSAVPASRAAGPDPPPPRNRSRKQGDKSAAAPAEGTSPEQGNGGGPFPTPPVLPGPRGCLATAHTLVTFASCSRGCQMPIQTPDTQQAAPSRGPLSARG